MVNDTAESDRSEIKRVFDAVVELSPADAELAIVRDVPDPAVAAEVRSLLRWHREQDGFLDEPLIRLADVTADPLIGQAFGAWRIVEVIGRGGMGVVYRAERADGAFERPAAIKVIGAEADATGVVERFRLEQRTLANLDHRNIARLLDGGTTPDGRPYFVMEFIDGARVDAFCDARALAVDERLELFVRICNGVRYAHENLVVHRDIKPDNVLVTADGTPKLLDFGIAHLLSRDASPQPQDGAATWLLTPDFASPEQLDGRASTTGTDVYSLGIMLYLLLTGERPYRIAGATQAALRDALAGVAVRAPSVVARHGESAVERAARRGTTPDELARRLCGDLDAITLKALARASDERYSSVAELLQDLRAYRTHRPVAARPPTASYVTAKFARRHTKPLAAAALLGIAVVAGVGAVVWQGQLAALERARAERRFNDVRQLANTFMFDVNDSIANVPGTMATRELIVKTAVEYLDGLAREAAGDAEMQRELARAWIRVGDVQGNPTAANLGDSAGAMRSYRRAVALATEAQSSLPDDLDSLRTLARVHRSIGEVRAWTGDLAAALDDGHRSAQLYSRIARAPEATPEDRLEAAISLLKEGDLLGSPNLPNLGRRDDAKARFEEALAAFRALDTVASPNLRARRFVGLSLERLGTLHETASEWEAAEATYQSSFEIRRQLAAAEPTHRNIQRDLAIAYEKLGKVAEARRGAGAGVPLLRSALAQFDRLAASDPADANAARSLAISREILAGALLRAEQPADARALYESALTAHRAIATRDAENAQARCDVVRTLALVGDAFERAPDGIGMACERWRDSARADATAAPRAGRDSCAPGGPQGQARRLERCG